MSSGGQVVGGIVGAAAGFVVGGPTGAIYGAQIGIMAGGLLDPPKGPTVEGPRLGDLSVQTSTYGQFIPRTYGTIGLSGNVFWLENNQIKEVVRKKKSGGKGGGSSSTVKTYTYFATFAVGLCEGPIAGVRRIWVGPDLVYDAGSDDLETIISSNQASSGFTIYLGTDIQQPDPRIQAEIGVANCPAYRGLAYIVVKDLPLANYGNSVAGAQVKVEVVNSISESSSIVGESQRYINTQSYGGTNARTINGLSSYSVARSNLAYQLTQYASSSIESRLEYLQPAQFTTLQVLPGSLISYEHCFRSAPYSIPITEYFIGAGNNIGGTVFSTGPYSPALVAESGDSIFAITENSSFKFITRVTDGILHSSFTGGLRGISGTGAGVVTFRNNPTLEIEVFSSDLISSGAILVSGASSGYDPYMPCACDGVYLYICKDMPSSSSNILEISRINILTGEYSQFISYSSISWLSTNTFNLQYSLRISDGVLFLAGRAGNYRREVICTLNMASSNQIELSDIFSSECRLSSIIKPEDVDASGLADSVTGFKVTATGSIRNAIEPLRGAWPFDVVQSGYKIKATSRGSASVVTIPVGDLAIDTQLTESREMDSQLPQSVTVKYIDRDRDYDANEQRAQRDNTEAVNSLVLELPVVLSATQSAQVADKLIRIYALEKSDFSFTLPAPYRYLEPGDVVTIATDDADYVLRLVSVNQTADGRLECAGRPSSAATYTSIAPGDGGQQGGAVIPLAGATIGILIDCPVIDEGLQDAPGFAVGMNGYSAGWPGGVLYRTADNGQTWDDLQAITGRATAGFASTILSASYGNLIQRGGSLTVSLIGGTLESVTEAQMLNGANIAAYGVNGRWEIIRFQNATINVDGTYTLDTFWRGDKGTEWATGLHAANDYFVLMTDPDLAFVGMPTDSIGQPRDYRSVTAGADIDSAASASFTYDAVNLEALSGVHPKGVRSAGDLTVTWQRRTRVGGAWRDYVDASLGEASQAYEIDVMDGAAVKRTLTATTPSVLYTSAMQVSDFGSPQSSVTVNIYQLSAVVGRGYKLEATL